MSTVTLPRELVERALSALEESIDTIRNEYQQNWRHGIPTRNAQMEGQRQAVVAHELAIHDLRTALAAQQAEPLFLLHTGKIDGGGEQDEWETEADSGARVDAFCAAHPGQTIGLYAHPPAQPAQAAAPASSPVGDGGAGREQAERMAYLEAALNYHSAAYRGRLPEWVPARVRLPADVFGDAPFRGRGVPAGDHDCQCNQHGAVSVVDRGGKLLGLRPAEFEVIAWKQVAQAKGGAA